MLHVQISLESRNGMNGVKIQIVVSPKKNIKQVSKVLLVGMKKPTNVYPKPLIQVMAIVI